MGLALVNLTQLASKAAVLCEIMHNDRHWTVQGSVATRLRCGGCCHMGFVANFTRFPAVQKF